MNILITSEDSEPQFIAGDKRVSLTLAKEWIKMGNKVCIVSCAGSRECPPHSEVEGVQQYTLPNREDASAPENVQALRSLIVKEQIDIVLQQHLLIPSFVRLVAQVRDLTKVVSVLHFDINHEEKIIDNSFFIQWKNGHSLSRYVLDTLLYLRYQFVGKRQLHKRISTYYGEVVQSSDRVALLSAKMKDEFCQRSLCQSQQVMAIPNPADFSAIRTKSAQAKEKVVVWCGRLDFSQKRLDRMLRIWRQVSVHHPDWQLKVLGSGNWDYWKSLVQSHHLKNVEIVGFCNPNPYYERASIVCMTSTTEGWGMVLIEGQVHGCAVMAYDSYASVSDIITDGENGVIVPAFNECEYARRLSELMGDDALRQRMAQNGTQTVRRFASTNIAKRWISEFEQL